jgi:putative Holliday junction resolvase
VTRVLGLDLGTRRIGVAVSDLSGTLASPHSVLERARRPSEDHTAIAALVAELGAERVIVGMPVSLSGASGPAAQAAEKETAALAAMLAVPVESFDERLTTVAAHRAMAAAGVRSKQRRKSIDAAAAAVMLQNWLDRGPRER